MKLTSKKLFTALAAGVISCALLNPQGEAAPVTGDITINGEVRYDTLSLGSATRAIGFGGSTVAGVLVGFPTVTSGTGTLSTGAPNGSLVVFTTPYVLNSAAVQPLYTVGGFTFTLSSSTIVGQSASFLNVTGSGTITGGGFDPTPGLWVFSSTSAGGADSATFGFTSNTTAARVGVPEGGSALALLGIALLGVEAVRRKLAVS